MRGFWPVDCLPTGTDVGRYVRVNTCVMKGMTASTGFGS